MDISLHYLTMANQMLIQKRLLERVKASGLTLGQPKVLDYLKDHDGASQKEIAAGCFIEAGSLTSILNRMEEKGLIERRMPGHEKTGRQVTFSADLIYDTLRRHDPQHLLLRCAREDAARGLLDVARLGELLSRIQGRIRVYNLPKVSPFAVPMLMEIGKERAPGTSAADMMLEDAALIDEAA